jgi:hypothetical protein
MGQTANIGKATQNGHAERLIRILKAEDVGLSEYHDDHDA